MVHPLEYMIAFIIYIVRLINHKVVESYSMAQTTNYCYEPGVTRKNLK